MARPVKQRSYDNASRRAASAATRQRVVDAARDLLVTKGYAATTTAAIAVKAGVNTDTVYALVGRKAVIVREVVEQAISGTDRAIPAEERGYVREIQSSTDAEEMIVRYAAALRVIHERMAPLFIALRDAAPTAPEAAALWSEISTRRADNMRRFAGRLQALGGLRDGLTVDDAADTVWVTNSTEVYTLLTVERGWTPAHYERWLVDAWRAMLLPR
jgi:AcrR family transcriptional regulator